MAIIQNTTPLPIDDVIEVIDEKFHNENGYYLSETNPVEFAKTVAIEFAKLHVEAALLQASEKADLIFDDGQCEASEAYSINRSSILNSYPLNLIK